MENKGQVTIFIIIAIIIVFGVVLFFLLRDGVSYEQIPTDLQPVYNSFLFCLEEEVLTGVELLEFQGGYINLPDLVRGSGYIPFSSQLNFLGNPVPYWYYISGNGIQKTQVPSKSSMEKQLEEFVNERIKNCDLEEFSEQGFDISTGEPDTMVEIREKSIEVDLDMEIRISKADKNSTIEKHEISVSSVFGDLYNKAKAVYEHEFNSMFLENYSIDVLRLYAPVDGVELSCSPKLWNADEIFDELEEAIEINVLALRTDKGIKADDYFLVDLPIKNEVRFINSRDWPNTFEVNPSKENFLIAEPVGNQQGLGIIGFCYVTYHFVYDLKFPVMVQVYDSSGDEFFQFPILVVIEANQPRKSLSSNTDLVREPELCKFKNVLTNVFVSPVDAKISYECFTERCEIGETTNRNLQAGFPQCVNGFVVARAEGFEETRQIYSSVSKGIVNINLKKIHELDVKIKSSGLSYNGNAIITFTSDKGSKTINYPDFKKVNLSEGNYEIQVYAFRNSPLQLEKGKKEQCVGSGFSQRCFEIEIPEQLISSVLVGGGKSEIMISELELSRTSILEIDFEKLRTPRTLEQLQNNYLLTENKNLDIELK